MEMYVDHQLHLVSIWLPNDEKDVAILEPVYRKYKEHRIVWLFSAPAKGIC